MIFGDNQYFFYIILQFFCFFVANKFVSAISQCKKATFCYDGILIDKNIFFC